SSDIEDHVPVFRRSTAVPPLEEIRHHYADLPPLPAEHLLQLAGIDRIGSVRLRVVLEFVGSEKHLGSSCDAGGAGGTAQGRAITAPFVDGCKPCSRGGGGKVRKWLS